MNSVKYLTEIIGTFFFISIILNTKTNKNIGAIGIAVGLLAAIYFGGAISGGHFNPAVSLGMYMKNDMTFNLLIGYILSQIIGAGFAVQFNNSIMSIMNN